MSPWVTGEIVIGIAAVIMVTGFIIAMLCDDREADDIDG